MAFKLSRQLGDMSLALLLGLILSPDICCKVFVSVIVDLKICCALHCSSPLSVGLLFVSKKTWTESVRLDFYVCFTGALLHDLKACDVEFHRKFYKSP